MQGDKLVPKKIKESSASNPAKTALATIWQYEVNRADRTRGPYKEAYKSAITSGAEKARGRDEN